MSSTSSAPSAADSLRERGNALFKEQKFQQAIELYEKALELAPQDAAESRAILQNNIAMAAFSAKHFERCISACDAVLAQSLQTTSLTQLCKAASRKARALKELPGRLQDARAVALAALRYFDRKPLQSEANLFLAMKQCYEEIERLCTKQEYEPITQANCSMRDSISVQYQSIERGKGVFAKKSFEYGQVIFKEMPLVSHRNVGGASIPSCFNCLRQLCSAKHLLQSLGLADRITAANDSVEPHLVHCSHCEKEAYCSEQCCDDAWKQYHRVMCSGSAGKGTQQNHPQTRLYELAENLGRTNPLVIARMFGMIVTRAMNGEAEPSHEFDRFCMNEEKHAQDEDILLLIKSCLEQNCPKEVVDKYVTIYRYRNYNGAILRNAATLNPISELHSLVQNLSDKQQLSLLWTAVQGNDKKGKPPTAVEQLKAEILQSDYFANICLVGTGLFTVHNMMNHSCLPTAVSMSNSLNHELSVVALGRVSPGDEVTISYIDESMPKAARQAALVDRYLFECTCPKCRQASLETSIFFVVTRSVY